MVAVLLEGLIVSCRRMLSVEDRVAIMVGLEAVLSEGVSPFVYGD